MLKMAQELKATILENNCMKFICQNFPMLASKKQFKSLDKNILLEIMYIALEEQKALAQNNSVKKIPNVDSSFRSEEGEVNLEEISLKASDC
jgi:hypothetical protein